MKTHFWKIFLFILILMTTLEAKKRYTGTMRPYINQGITYHPFYVKVGHKEYGIASWYGKGFHNNPTSSGERYNMYALSGAHKRFPMGTMVRVTNLKNRKSVVVKINDRGPFIKGRVIDCSYRAGKALGLDKLGIAKVKIEVIGLKGKVASKKRRKKPSFKISNNISKKREPKKITIKKPHLVYHLNSGNFFLQIGSFYNLNNANHFRIKNAKKYGAYRVKQQQFFDVTAKAFYRVFITGFASKNEALAFQKRYHLNQSVIIKV